MAKIKKIKEGTATVYPATIPQAVIDPTSGKSVRTELNEKEAVVNKKTTLTNSDTDYPTTKVLTTVKTEVDGRIDDLGTIVIRHEAEIASIENTINSANINQETTATVTGVDTVALPKTAANTGMQVQMFGQSATQLVTNGNFANGVPEWTYFEAGSTITASNGIATFTKTGVSGRLGRLLNYIKDNKYYIMANVTKNEFSIYSALGFSLFLPPYTTGGFINITAFTTGKFSGIIQPTDDSLERGLFIQNGGTLDIGKTLDFDWIGVINLTATFGAGKEPTKEQCDLLFANYFEGSDNVLGTGRVRSVGKNLFDGLNLNGYVAGFVNTQRVTIDAPMGYVYAGDEDGVIITQTIPIFAVLAKHIQVNQNTGYTFSAYYKKGTASGCHLLVNFLDDKGEYLGAQISPEFNNTTYELKQLTFTTPAGCCRVLCCLYTASLNGGTNFWKQIQLERASTATAYESYRQSILQLTTPELRSNGLIKDEIRKGTNGYELVKRVGVGTLTEKVTNAADREFSSDTGFWSLSPTYCEITGGNLVFTNTANGTGLVKVGFLTIGKRYKITLTDVVVTEGYISFGGSLLEAPLININTAIIERTSIASATTFLTIGYDNLTCSIGGISIKELDEADGAAASSVFTEIGSNVHYTLATPVITPIPHSGLLNSNANGTVYFEPIIADAGVYSSNIAIQLTDYPIASFESIRKYANGTYTELNTATAVITSGGLSFTHPDLVSGDLVMFIYAYNKESIGRSMTLTHYDSRFVEADTANGKVYRIVPVVTNGVVSWTAVEV